MTSLASELTDRVIPHVPVRQFVLSVPHRLRYLLAYDHQRCTAVLRIFIRALTSYYRRRATRDGVHASQCDSVTFVQRFGSAANLNIHYHVLALDGVFSEDATSGQVHFHATPTPTDDGIAALVATLRKRILRYIARQGLLDDDAHDTDPIAEEAPLLASCYAGSIDGRQVFGRRRGAKLQRIGADPEAPWVHSLGKLQAHVDGFDLHAGLSLLAQRPDHRQRLEKVLRYCARPPIAEDRLTLRADGHVVLKLKTPWKDGSTHVVYEPVDFMSKLAALIPRPHKNLVLYHGVLAPNATWRSRAVAYGRAPSASRDTTGELPRHQRRQWAELMHRSFDVDVLACPQCSGRMRLIAVVLEHAAVRKILAHLGVSNEPPRTTPAQSPPETDTAFYDVA